MTKIMLAAGMALAMVGTSAHALVVSPTDDAAALSAALLAPSSGITISAGSETLIGSTVQQGTYTDFNLSSTQAGMPTLSMPDGVVLTSGDANFSTTTNTTNSYSINSGTGAYQPLVDLATTGGLNTTQFNANVLEFEFTLDDAVANNSITANFLFATDEFPTQSVTDIMGIFINGINYAFFPNGDLVSNQSGDPNSFFNNNPVGAEGYPIEWNGLTNVFTVIGLANPGVNTFALAISDTSDTIFDSAVFFGGMFASFTTGEGGIVTPTVSEPAMIPLMLGVLGAMTLMRRRLSA